MADVTWCREILLHAPDSIWRAIDDGNLNIPPHKGHLNLRSILGTFFVFGCAFDLVFFLLLIP